MSNNSSVSVSQGALFCGVSAALAYAYLNHAKREVPRFLAPIAVAMIAIGFVAKLFECTAPPASTPSTPLTSTAEKLKEEEVQHPQSPFKLSGLVDIKTGLELPFSALWKPDDTLTREQAHQKMVENAKVIVSDRVSQQQGYILPAQAPLPPSFEQHSNRLDFSFTAYGTQGNRTEIMQDAHCCISLPNGGQLAVVADGHGTGSSIIAEALVDTFKKEFYSYLERNQNDPYKTFEQLVYDIAEQPAEDYKAYSTAGTTFNRFLAQILEQKHKRLAEHTKQHSDPNKWDANFKQLWIELHKNGRADLPLKFEDLCKVAGSTLVATYVTPLGTVYTATVGDSEAAIYRKIKETTQAIALSPFYKWTSPEELQRAAIAMGDKKTLDELPKWNKKWQRVWGLNVSRAVGDQINMDTLFDPQPQKINVRDKRTGVQREITYRPLSSMPTITVQQAQPGDVILVCCDGVTNYANPSEIAAQIERAAQDETVLLATRLAEYVVKEKKGQDHVTVVALKVLNKVNNE